MIACVYITSKNWNFKGTLINGKLSEITVLNAKGTILKKIYVLYSVHFSAGKCSLSIDVFGAILTLLFLQNSRYYVVFLLFLSRTNKIWIIIGRYAPPLSLSLLYSNTHNIALVWFLLFNGISTFMGYFNAKIIKTAVILLN